MSIPTTPIDSFGFVPGQNIAAETFPAADVLAAETLLAEELAARRPELDVSRNSTLHDTVVREKAISYLLVRRMLEAFRQTMSLKGIQDNPALASGDVTDAILSNLLIQRNSGEFATGWLRITVSSNRTNVIQQSTRFTSAEGYTYLSLARTAAVNSAPSDGQSQLYSSNDGTQWYFFVQVQAEVRGSAQNFPTSSGFTSDSQISDLVYISTGRPFSGGRDGDSVASLSDSVIRSLSVRNLVSQASMASGLPTLVTGALDVHSVGSSHPLMLRGKSNAFGLPMPGFVDVYLKSSREPSYRLTVAQATPNGSGTWTAVLDTASCAGVTDITAIRPASGSTYGSFDIVHRQRTFVPYSDDAYGNMVSPNRITEIRDCAGSVYQRCSAIFSLSSSDQVTLGVTTSDPISVEVETLATDLIPEAHLVLTGGDTVPDGYDILARPFIPCLVTFGTIQVSCDNPLDPLIAQSIRSAIASFVNSTPPGSPLVSDGMVSAIRGISGVRSVSLPIRTTGTIILPDEEFTREDLTALGNLEIRTDPARGIGRDNVAFMINADDINVNLTRWTI